MKTIAYCVLHYGKEYLEYSLKSIDPFVDEILILYTDKPSFGHRGTLANPDRRGELQDIANKFPKVTWMEASHSSREADHRMEAVRYCRNKGYDVALVIDSDEVWDPTTVEGQIKFAYDNPFERYGVRHDGWHHFWRGFDLYCQDGFCPIRLMNLKRNGGEKPDVEGGRIYHFGYAISDELMRYKWSIHGHKNELRPGWIEKWTNYNREMRDLHPVAIGLWDDVKEFDKTKLPTFMRNHPKYGN